MKDNMNILAINSSASSGSIALAMNGKITQVAYLDVKRTHSERLMPMIDNALTQNNLQIKDLDLICVAIGPGSFTGIRIALATAKGLSFSHKIPLLAVDNLQLLADNLQGSARDRLVLIDARMSEVYTALYSKTGEILSSPKNCKPAEVLAELTQPVIIIGDGAEKYKDVLEASEADYTLANKHQNLDLASSLISYALDQESLPEFDYDFIAKLEPNYLRKSQAEIEKAKRDNQ